jgi:hypothetical protein
MEFHFVPRSMGEIAMFVAICIFTIAGAGVLAVAIRGKEGKTTDRIVYGGGTAVIVMLLLSAFGGIMLGARAITQNHATFSQQLMDEYHVKSNRDPGDTIGELERSGMSSAVFTRDGKDTPVLIRRIDMDSTKMTMEFIVLDNKSLYPKP